MGFKNNWFKWYFQTLFSTIVHQGCRVAVIF